MKRRSDVTRTNEDLRRAALYVSPLRSADAEMNADPADNAPDDVCNLYRAATAEIAALLATNDPDAKWIFVRSEDPDIADLPAISEPVAT